MKFYINKKLSHKYLIANKKDYRRKHYGLARKKKGYEERYYKGEKKVEVVK